VRAYLCLRLTTTRKWYRATFPEKSRAEQLTRVLPTRKMLPDFGWQATGTRPSLLSTALSRNETLFVDFVEKVTMLAGPKIVGGRNHEGQDKTLHGRESSFSPRRRVELRY
jgi:hypothetical protein